MVNDTHEMICVYCECVGHLCFLFKNFLIETLIDVINYLLYSNIILYVCRILPMILLNNQLLSISSLKLILYVC